MPLHHLIYESQATHPFTKMEAELVALLKQCRLRNKARGITGLLLYAADGRFVQVLEGEMEAIYELYFRHIAHDKRHHQLTLLASGPISHRRFADWRMGFRPTTPEALTALRGHFSTADATFLLPMLPDLPNAILDKLLDFVQYTVANPLLEEVPH